MSNATEQKVRERAYALWEKEGRPHGRDAEFWERARRMVEADQAAPPASATKGRARKDSAPKDSATDKALKESFPASDPPASTGATAGAAGPRKRKR